MAMLNYQVVQPVTELRHWVESFWMLTNESGGHQPIIILPDGRIDLSFDFSNLQRLSLLGLESGPSGAELPAGLSIFTISFRPLAVAYLFNAFLPLLPDSATFLPADYLGVTLDEFQNMEQFCALLTEELLRRIKTDMDRRKIKLFELMYASNGSLSVQELSDQVGWSSRQIHRYFHDTLGISPKTYCNILRFRASFPHIKKGRLFPEENYADQSHFIREIKKYAGVVPKELAQNKNDRFVQFSTLPRE